MASIADGRLHSYWPERHLTLFEHVPVRDSTKSSVAEKTLIFIGGLYDSFLSVRYVPMLASYIRQCPGWSLVEIQLSSSGLGWGTSDLDRDVEEMAKAVDYLRRLFSETHPDAAASGAGAKVVLMGLSTGCQDVLHYLYHKSKQERPPVDGAILQAAVSDREYLTIMREAGQDVQDAYEECLRISLNSEAQSPRAKVSTLPLELTTVLGWPRAHVSCERFLSIASPFSPARPGPDDLFSSDLSDDTLRKTFGAVGVSGLLKPSDTGDKSMLILLSGKDQFTPRTVDKESMISRWKSALESGGARLAPNSGLLPGATHEVKEHAAQFDLADRVLRYIDDVFLHVPNTVFLKLKDDQQQWLENRGNKQDED